MLMEHWKEEQNTVNLLIIYHWQQETNGQKPATAFILQWL